MENPVSPNSIKNITPGNHIVCIYRTKEEMLAFMIPFFIDGIEKRNKCVYILGDQTSEEVTSAFKSAGFDLSPYISTNQFSFASTNDIYFKNGVFNKEEVIAKLIFMELKKITKLTTDKLLS